MSGFIHSYVQLIIEEGDEYTVANDRAVNHFLPQLRKYLRKRIVELMVNLDKLSVDPLCKEIERTVEQYKYTYDMPKDEALVSDQLR
jgi:hypothetical protein